MKSDFSSNGITSYLQNALPVYLFDEIDSTNAFAKTLTEDFALVVSDSQISGRGRLGRTFFSPKGVGIYMSLKIKLSDLYQNVPFITTLAAVSVHQSVKKLYDTDCGIKWVNDLYIGKKKVCGILCEAIDSSHAVIGIGINVYPSPLPEELKNTVTHLATADSSVSRNQLIASVADNIINLLSLLPDTSFMDYYKAHSNIIGKDILCIQPDCTFTATAVDITDTGALIVKTQDGFRALSTGEITIRFTD